MTRLSKKMYIVLRTSSLIPRQTHDDLRKGMDRPNDSKAHEVDCIQVSLARPSLRKELQLISLYPHQTSTPCIEVRLIPKAAV